MGKPSKCGCCCPEVSDSACPDSGLPGLAHEWIGSHRFVDNVGATEEYTEELISYGCSHDLAWSAFGYNGPEGGPTQRVRGTIQPSIDDWTAGLILWSETWQEYDPFAQGSVAHIRSTAKARTFSARTDLPAWAIGEPRLWFAPVIEQGGKTYVGRYTNAVPTSRCWLDIAGDTDDGGEVDPVNSINAHFSRKPYSYEDYLRCALANAAAGRCEDDFVEFDTGGILIDSRPDLSLGINAHPVTRAGLFVGLTSAAPDVGDEQHGWPDEYPVDLLFDRLCAVMKTHGIYRIGSDPLPDDQNYPDTNNIETLGSNRGSPLDLGTLIIDEPLDTLPGGWQRADVFDSTGPGAAAGKGGGGQFSIVDGLLTSDTLSEGEYLNGAYFIELTGMPVPPFAESFQLLIEFTWHHVRDVDRCNPNFGVSAPDPNEYRNAAHGVFLGEAFRFTANCMAPEDYDAQNGSISKYPGSWHYGYTVHTIPSLVGGLDRTVDADDVPPGWSGTGIARNNSVHPARFGYDGNLGNAFTPPMSGDRYSILIRRSVFDADVSPGFPEEKERYSIHVYSNGREVSPGGGGLTTFPRSSLWNIGLIAIYGGRWSDLKVWLRE